MKKITCTFVFAMFISILFGQYSADTLWTRTYGGSNDDPPYYFPRYNPKMVIDSLGFVYIATSTQSEDGDINNNHGEHDGWILKISPYGDTLWTKIIGGSRIDAIHGITLTNDGNIAICGFTYSNDGDLQNNHDADGSHPDGFISVLTPDGNIIWTRLYGGFEAADIGGDDYFYGIITLKNGNLMAFGETNSFNGDLYMDFDKFNTGWILEVNSENGNIILSKKIVGKNHNENNPNEIFSMVELSDSSGFVALGRQWYMVQNKIWLVKINYNGDTLWSKEYGCNNYNQPSAIALADSGKIIFSATINEQSGDVENFNGGYDIWVVKTDSSGKIIKQNTFGGDIHEVPYALKKYDKNNWLISAQTSSDIYAEDTCFGFVDFLLIKFDNELNLNLTKQTGGSDIDALTDIIVCPENDTVYILGRTASNDIYINNNHGGYDIWLAKISITDTSSTHKITKFSEINIFPNPANKHIFIKGCKNENVKIYNILGKMVLMKNIYTDPAKINISELTQGIYLLKTSKNSFIFIKQN